VGAVQRLEWGGTGLGPAERLRAATVTSGYFRVFGVTPAAGRLFDPTDEEPGAPPVVVISDARATRSLGSADAAVGRAVTLDGVSHTIIGVLPPGMDEIGGVRASAWPALRLTPPTRRGPFFMRGVGLLKPGVTFEQATRELSEISERIYPVWASSFSDRIARITPVELHRAIIGTSDRQLGVFAAAVALVLLVAMVNVATLALVRASARGQELAVRRALGATRSRLTRLLVTEHVVLASVAALAGIGFAAAGLQFVATIAPTLPRIAEIGLDGYTVAFAFGCAAFTAIVMSISPIASLFARETASLRTDERRIGTSRRTNVIRGALVTAEFALALPLLLGAGLLLHSFARLQRVDPGFDPDGIMSVNVALPSGRYPDYPDMMRFWRRVVSAFDGVPGFAAVGLSSAMPPDDAGEENNFDLIDKPVADGASEPTAPWAGVTPGYFEALGVPLLEGRHFTLGDTANVPGVILVSRSWADRYYPNESPVGKTLVAGGCRTCPPTTVIGVVGDVKYLGLAGNGDAVYQSIDQTGPRYLNLFVRSRLAPAATFDVVRERIAAIDPELVLAETTLSTRLDAALGDPRRLTMVLSSFAGAAAALAALGIFGLMSYVVRQRRREIGVRIALGAEPASVTWMIVTRGMRYALIGTAVGFGIALAEARWLEPLLFQVETTDPLTLVAGAMVLLAAGVLACWIPGRRAARVAPTEAIGGE
jgi:predicted permease